MSKKVLDSILEKLSQGRYEITTHGFRRGLATSLRVALAMIGLGEKKKVPKRCLKAIGKLFSWSKGKMFWKYTVSYELFLSKQFLTCETVYYYVLGDDLYNKFCDARASLGSTVKRFDFSEIKNRFFDDCNGV